MKVLSDQQQHDLQDLLERLSNGVDSGLHEIRYWAIELKPKRVRKKTILETHESVIEDAYKEHTGQI